MKVRLSSFNPLTNTSYVFDRKDLVEYTEWVERAYNDGYRCRRVKNDDPKNDLVMFLPTAVNSELNNIFTAVLEND